MVLDISPGYGPGEKSPDETADFVSCPGPVDLGVFLAKFGKISFFLVILGDECIGIGDVSVENDI